MFRLLWKVPLIPKTTNIKWIIAQTKTKKHQQKNDNNNKIELSIINPSITIITKQPIPGVPVFLSTPPSLVYISNGSDVQLSCSSSGHPRPIITWFRNKQPIREHIKPLPDSHHQSNTQQSDNKKKSGLSNSQYDYYTDIDVIKAKSSKSNKNKEAQNRKQIQSKNNNNNNNNNNSSNSSDAREHFTYDNKRVNSVNSTLFIHHFTSPVLTPSSPLLPFFTPPPLPSPSSLSSSLFFPSSPTSTTPTFSCSATNPYGSVSHSFKILVPGGSFSWHKFSVNIWILLLQNMQFSEKSAILKLPLNKFSLQKFFFFRSLQYFFSCFFS